MNQPPTGATPPKWAERFLIFFCREDYVEQIQGDLHELFVLRVEAEGMRKARALYCLDVLRSFRPYLLKRNNPDYQQAKGPIMLLNYLTVALRHMLRKKGYSAINLLGLVGGLTSCIFILLFIQHELSYDRFHANGNNIYRITTEEVRDGNTRHAAYNYGPCAPALLNDFEQIRHAVRVFPKNVAVSADRRNAFQENRFMFVDSTFFDVFSFELQSGTGTFESPYDMVVTAETAERYFGTTDAVGKLLVVEDTYTFKITGIMKPVPDNSHLQFDFLASMGSMRDISGFALRSWYHPPMYTYALLEPHASAAALSQAMPGFVGKHMGEEAVKYRRLHLQPFNDIHLYSDLDGELSPNGSILYVYVFATIALFILLIACINFMNLATARSANRAREVGMRKVVGARRSQIVRQFFSEALLYAFLALGASLLLVELLLPYLNELFEKNLSVDYLANWEVVAGFFTLALLVGLVSGSYPAIFMSQFKPISVLHNLGTGLSRSRFRSALVVVQFSVSIFLIISSFVIQDQMNFIHDKRLGFDKDHVVIIPVYDETIQRNWPAVKNSLLAHSNVLSVSATSTIPGIDRDIDFPVEAEGVDPNTALNIQTMLVDYDFLKTLGMEMESGRDFSESYSTDFENAFILNQSAVREIGWTQPLGKKFKMFHLANGNHKEGHIVGVVKDFHFRSLHHAIDPLVVQISPQYYYLDNLAVKISPHDVPLTIGFLEQTFKKNRAPSPTYLYIPG